MERISILWIVLAAIFLARPVLGIDDTRERIYDALEKSPLTPFEKIQHVFNRLGYGTNASNLRADWFILRRSDNSIDVQATNFILAGYIQRMLGRRSKNQAVIQEKVESLYPLAGSNYGEIITVCINSETEIGNSKRQIDAILKGGGTPPKSLYDFLLAARSRYMQFRNGLIHAEQAENFLYATLDNSPLFWVMLDFWFNHFNVFGEKVSPDISDYRNAIASHMFGKFSDLLLVTAHHPGMLIYLDNYLNHVVKLSNGKVLPKLNENYGREVIELHSLGVAASDTSTDATYNQGDVVEAAKILTGWGIKKEAGVGRYFFFSPTTHYPGPKTVMRHTFEEGEQGGIDFLHFLAQHPKTSKNIARKLTRVFITEDLSSEMGQSAVQRLTDSMKIPDATLLDIYVDMLSSPEFWSRDAYRAKVKQPLRFVSSALRAVGYNIDTIQRGQVEDGLSTMKSMGQKLFYYVFPTGFPQNSVIWGSTSAAMASVRYGFQIAGYHGPQDSARAEQYQNWESYAQSVFYSPNKMGKRGKAGFEVIFDFLPFNSRYHFPVDLIDGDGAFVVGGASPDRTSSNPILFRNYLPLRTISGMAIGSADFLKF